MKYAKIPDDIIAKIPTLARRAIYEFRRTRNFGSIEHGLGSVYLKIRNGKFRRIKVFCYRQDDEGNYAESTPNEITLFRDCVAKQDGPPICKTIRVQRILAHEIVHSITDRPLSEKQIERKDEMDNADWYCTIAEFRAEMAAILQIGLPYVLKTPSGRKALRQYFDAGYPAAVCSWPELNPIVTGYIETYIEHKKQKQLDEYFRLLKEAANL